MSTTPDYGELISRAEIKSGMLRMGERIEFGSDADVIDDLVCALRELMRAETEARLEAQKQKERLFKQIDFTGELQRLLWALAEGNPLPDTIKGSHAYTVASRAKARFGGTPE